jgi:hypothetical protein
MGKFMRELAARSTVGGANLNEPETVNPRKSLIFMIFADICR